MTNSLDTELAGRLDALRGRGLYRELQRVDSAQSPSIRILGESLLNFSSNDYLGLANEPEVKEAAARALDLYGAGAGSSRLLCGSLAPHHELDETLARFKDTEAALSFSSGYTTALGAVCSLLGKGDYIVIDKLVHACIVDAARLCGATLRVFAHNDLDDLERILKWIRSRPGGSGPVRHALIVTESVFSMDGDHAPLRGLVDLKERYGAWLMVDEAHATGLYGKNRRGLAEECNLNAQIDVHMGTLGKSVGSSGGYICGSRTLIDYLVNRARTFIFSTAPVPAAAAAATAGIRYLQSNAGEQRRQSLWQRVAQFTSCLAVPPSHRPSAIIPLVFGLETKAVEAAASLRGQGIFIPAIRFPTVPRNRARLRVTLTAAHGPDDVLRLSAALRNLRFEI